MYVHQLSDIFRYILQSDRKGLVSLREELEFMLSFQYVMEVRFANKLTFSVRVEEERKDLLMLPVLSLLPLVDNVVVHNRIDSEHKMEISIVLNGTGRTGRIEPGLSEAVCSRYQWNRTCEPGEPFLLC